MNIEELYDSYADTVYRFFYIQCLDKQTAEDLTSQTFMSLVERAYNQDAADIRDGKKFVYGVMRKVWLMHLRLKYRRNEQAVEGIEDFAGYVEIVVDEYAGQTAKQRAEVFINRLPAKQREVVTRRLLHEHPIKQIAIDMGKDTNYVKTTYKRGIKRLRELVAQPTEEVL